MRTIQTDDPKLAVHHIIGSWAAGQTCPGAQVSPSLQVNQEVINDDIDALVDWSD
ncbi:MAG: hypothetical protein F6K19_45965 [Cyanothece sp. SIO1E1]|nr:hypothetical protein [Cyanothece sp. SIO1E1]